MRKSMSLATSIHRAKESSSRVRRFCRIVNNERIKSKKALAIVTELCERYYDRLFAQLIPDLQKMVAPAYHQCKELLELATRQRRFGQYAAARYRAEEAQRKLKSAFATLPFNFQIGWSEVMDF
jgi:hypothetical protein